MKILIATDNYPPRYDGISRFLKEIIPALTKKHEVSVIAPDFGETKDKWDVTKIKVLSMQIGDFHPTGLHFFKIWNRVRKADVVFVQTLGSIGGLALLAAKLCRKKMVLYTHSIEWELVPRSLESGFIKRFLPDILKRIDKTVYNWIDVLLMPSEGVSEAYYWNKIENKRRILHLGVDTKKFKPPRSKEAAKKKIGFDPDTTIIGYHGRIAREKDLRTLLRGYLRYKKSTKKTTHLLLVGDGLHEIKELFERGDTTVTGFQEDVVPYLQAMDVYGLSSLTETSCLSVMEAMSCGLPVVSTPVGYVKDYITHGNNGYLYAEKDTVMLAKLIEEALKNKKKIGRSAREYIQTRYSWDQTREEIVKIFDRL